VGACECARGGGPAGGRACGLSGAATGYCHGNGSAGARATPSWSAARCHASPRAGDATGLGAVSRMNRSIAATTAAASSGEPSGATSVSFGRRFNAPRG
jgi:hypothetical protein